MRKLTIVFLVLFLVACGQMRFTPTPVPATATAVASHTPASQQCYFNWATQALPDLTKEVQAAIDKADLVNVKITVEAFGEDCTDPLTNQTVSFSTMETDFHVIIPVTDLGDTEQMGTLLEKVLLVLDGFPTGMTPGPQPGYIGIDFQSGSDDFNLWFPVTLWTEARELGLHGADLLEKLHNK